MGWGEPHEPEKRTPLPIEEFLVPGSAAWWEANLAADRAYAVRSSVARLLDIPLAVLPDGPTASAFDAARARREEIEPRLRWSADRACSALLAELDLFGVEVNYVITDDPERPG